MSSTSYQPSETGVHQRGMSPDPVSVNYHKHDLLLLKSAHSSSCSINKIAEKNFLQNDLLDSIENFITSIETKLDRIESYFKSNDQVEGKTCSDKMSEESMATLESLYETLISIKNSVFESTPNLDDFNKIIDDHYGNLLESIESTNTLGFHEKLLTCLHFIDAKINQFNDLAQEEARHLIGGEIFEPVDHKDPLLKLKSFEIKFHNYETAAANGLHRLLHYYELPFPWRENNYIIHGYRFHSNHLHSLQSMCTLHNESANIWTHFAGAFLFLYISIFSFPSTDLFKRNSFQDNLVLYFFFAASIKCLLSSTFWHTFNGTSNLYLKKKFACVDYTGITTLIIASVITTEYASLYYMPILRTGFVIFSLICGLIGFAFNWSSKFDRPESRPLRIGFFISLAACGFAAFGFLVFQRGLFHSLQFYSPLLKSFAAYLTGVVFYGSSFPEIFRSDVIIDQDLPTEEFMMYGDDSKGLESYFKPQPEKGPNHGKFISLWWIDYIFSSHNIWHVFVLLGIYCHYTAIYEMFENIPFNK